MIADSDSDDLPDNYKFVTENHLNDLKGHNPKPGRGTGTGNFDGDTLSYQQEFQLSCSVYPLLSPLPADTDSGGLHDGVELNPTAPRPLTNPTIADTDGDGLNDQVENNSGTFVSATNPGTSPVDYDSDDDAFPDNYEILRGSAPLNTLQLPTLPASLTTAALTTDETSGIGPAKTSTHAISGGFCSHHQWRGLRPAEAEPACPRIQLDSDKQCRQRATFNEINTSTFADWSPPAGNVTGPTLLELWGGFHLLRQCDLPGSFLDYTLTGLTAGPKYETRLQREGLVES